MTPFPALLRGASALLAASAGACVLAAAPASAADAPPTASDAAASGCIAPALSSPFSDFGDQRSYFLAPGGDFRSPGVEDWQLGPGARIVSATEHGGSDGSVLSLAPGAVAQSAPTCVDLDHPTARVWGRGFGTGVTVLVSYLDEGRFGRTRLAGRVRPSLRWDASDDLDVRPEVGGAAAGYRRATFTFIAGATSAQLDDLYVDPRMH